MSEFMRSILSRVLSQEIGHQEKWKNEEEDKYGYCNADRDNYVKEIQQFMQDNNIEFRTDFYLEAVR